jgi:hypothetical protein
VAAFEEDGDLVPPLHPFQNGFHSRRSTGDAIIALQEMIMAFDHRLDSRPPPPRPRGQRGRPWKPPKSHPILMFLDIRVAYDSVVSPLVLKGILELDRSKDFSLPSRPNSTTVSQIRGWVDSQRCYFPRNWAAAGLVS